MATLWNKKKLLAVLRETPEGTRSSRAQNALDPELTQDYISQVSEEIDGRVTKKLSKEFSRTESRILGALSKLTAQRQKTTLTTTFNFIRTNLWSTMIKTLCHSMKRWTFPIWFRQWSIFEKPISFFSQGCNWSATYRVQNFGPYSVFQFSSSR